MELDKIINLLKNVDPFSHEISNHSIIKKEVLRRRRKGLFSKYDNITINHFDDSCNFFEIHIKVLGLLKNDYDHFIHRINKKHIDNVIKYIKQDKSRGEYNFSPGTSWDEIECIGHKTYREFTKKERNRLYDSDGRDYVYNIENTVKIDFELSPDNDQFQLIKYYDGQGNRTIKICRYYEDYNELLRDERFFTFSKRSVEAYNIIDARRIQEDDFHEDLYNDFDYDKYLDENPHLKIAEFEKFFRESFFAGMSTKKDVLEMSEESLKSYFLMSRDQYIDGELFSIAFNGYKPLCFAMNGTGYIFIEYDDFYEKFIIRKTNNYVQDFMYVNDDLINNYNYKQNLVDAQKIVNKLGWV